MEKNLNFKNLENQFFERLAEVPGKFKKKIGKQISILKKKRFSPFGPAVWPAKGNI